MLKPPLLECQQIKKSFGTVKAVNQVSFALQKGEFLAVLGPSGCGKSTILRMIAGFELVDSGKIFLQNRPVSSPQLLVPPQQRSLGMVFQEIALFPHLNVSQNITFGLKGTARALQKRLEQMLELIGLWKIASQMPHTLSGGEQQRVALARALAPSPALMLLDEPFSSLDYQLRVQLRKDVRDILHQENVSTILVTHDQDEAFVFADRMLLIKQGEVVQGGTPTEIYHNPANAWVAGFVGETNFLPHSIGKPLFHPQARCVDLSGAESCGCQLMVRPEDIQATPCAGGQGHGMVEMIDFSGSQQFLKIRLRTGHRIRVCVSSKEVWHPQDGVDLRIHHYHLFPK